MILMNRFLCFFSVTVGLKRKIELKTGGDYEKMEALSPSSYLPFFFKCFFFLNCFTDIVKICGILCLFEGYVSVIYAINVAV